MSEEELEIPFYLDIEVNRVFISGRENKIVVECKDYESLIKISEQYNIEINHVKREESKFDFYYMELFGIDFRYHGKGDKKWIKD